MTADRIAVEGSFPLNTSGGNNGAGRTHGVSHHVDAVLQIRGPASKRQVAKNDLCLVETGPPPGGGARILSSTPKP